MSIVKKFGIRAAVQVVMYCILSAFVPVIAIEFFGKFVVKYAIKKTVIAIVEKTFPFIVLNIIIVACTVKKIVKL